MGNLCEIHVKWMGNSCEIYGKSMEIYGNRWEIYVKSMGNLWKSMETDGKFM